MELEKELTVQSKVNTDLKRLLVASVGEDLEARVHFLTEDKVKLAHDVHHYVQRLLDDHEEMEKLSIQCDVWRSKFLASSLVVDELAKLKAVLSHRYNEVLDTLQNLLDDQMNICQQLQNSYGYLKAVQKNVEPLIDQQCRQPDSIVSLSTEIEKIALKLHLIIGNSNKTFFVDKGKINFSPAQEKAKKMISESRLCFRPPSIPGIAQALRRHWDFIPMLVTNV
uniref:Uncharacterized protein n=1 Tax=Strigamia maritima TaxID=126957 RepID=T1IVG2_STRMM